MLRLRLRLALVAALLAPVWAQDGGEEGGGAPEGGVPAVAPPPARVVDEIRHEVQLRSGTLLVGGIEPVRWRVRTEFGVLEVPVADIRSVVFGRRADPERVARVAALVSKLASANPDRRNHARASLMEEGAFAVVDLVRASKDHDDPEVRRICKELVEELSIPDEDVVPDEDRVETTKFALTGTVESAQFKVNVPELGGINVMRRDIVRIRLFKAIRTREATVAGSNTWPNGWVDTKIEVAKGDRLAITAEGNIHFPNWGGQVFTPEGNPRMGQINGIPVGALAGRIGPNGQLFLIGRNYSGKAPVAGTLHLCLMINIQGQPSSGEYTVRIGRKE